MSNQEKFRLNLSEWRTTNELKFALVFQPGQSERTTFSRFEEIFNKGWYINNNCNEDIMHHFQYFIVSILNYPRPPPPGTAEIGLHW